MDASLVQSDPEYSCAASPSCVDSDAVSSHHPRLKLAMDELAIDGDASAYALQWADSMIVGGPVGRCKLDPSLKAPGFKF